MNEYFFINTDQYYIIQNTEKYKKSLHVLKTDPINQDPLFS